MSIARSSFYYEGRGESLLNLRLMRLIDEQFLETPFYRLASDEALAPHRQGYTVSSQAGAPADAAAGVCKRSSSGPGRRSRTRSTESIPTCCAISQITRPRPRLVCGCHLHPATAGLPLPRRGDGLGVPQGAVLAPVQHA